MKLDLYSTAVNLATIKKLLPDFVVKEVEKQVIPGPRGFKGNKGIQGETGTQGPDGPQGPQGPLGPQGPDGPQGPLGETGKDGIGIIGKRGLPGQQGQPGPHGRQGTKGLDGSEGNVGPQGDRGPQGDTGPSPHHEWMGFKLRFQNPDGSWGKYVDLKGPRGDRGDGSGALFDGFNHGNLIVVENNYTTSGNERIVCNAAVTVFLNPQPFNDETLHIKRVNGSVTLDGNGHTIDDEDTIIMTRENMNLRLEYVGALQRWVIT